MVATKTLNRRDVLFEQFAQGKRPSHPDVKSLKFDRRTINRQTIYRYFQDFKKAIDPAKFAELFPDEEGLGAVETQHAEELEETGESPSGSGETATGEVEGDNTQPPGGKPPKKTVLATNKTPSTRNPLIKGTDRPLEAVLVNIAPKAFTMSSTNLWAARRATIEQWGWPADDPMDVWLDRYLEETMRQHGIILGAYAVVGGNGHKGQKEEDPEGTEEEIAWAEEYNPFEDGDEKTINEEGDDGRE